MADGFLQVLGLMRWSHPSDLGAFRHDAPSLSALRETLYAPARLAERLFFLKHVTLPCIREQTDKNFRIVLLMGDQLPQPWRDRVLSLTETIPQIIPVFEREGQKHRDVCRDVMLRHRSTKAAAIAEFRLDDDDAMSLDFVAETRRVFRQNRKLLLDHKSFCIDYPKGIALVAGADGLALKPVYAPHVGIAQALIYRPDHPRSLLDYPHRRLWMSMPNLTFPGPVKWVRGVHATNDSGIAGTVETLPSWGGDPTELPLILAADFAMDWRGIGQAWWRLQESLAEDSQRC